MISAFSCGATQPAPWPRLSVANQKPGCPVPECVPLRSWVLGGPSFLPSAQAALQALASQSSLAVTHQPGPRRSGSSPAQPANCNVPKSKAAMGAQKQASNRPTAGVQAGETMCSSHAASIARGKGRASRRSCAALYKALQVSIADALGLRTRSPDQLWSPDLESPDLSVSGPWGVGTHAAPRKHCICMQGHALSCLFKLGGVKAPPVPGAPVPWKQCYFQQSR